MSELLAPAGDMESLIAAVSNGADAIYLALEQFGARAYAKNFTLLELEEAINYTHLRNVKIYVTMNTILFEDELESAYEQVRKLYLLNVDGIIVADLALISHITNNYPSLEVHASTQMGIDDIYAVDLFTELNVSRVVLAREVSIDRIKELKRKSKMALEVFIHGALCVSYSGNCLISGLIGYRSGNRGRCVGSCRKEYTLINKTKNICSKGYLLSMKDLSTIDNLNDLKEIDSLKIEGRMKESVYVANIVNSYRTALDNPSYDLNLINKNLVKTFNRTFTKGYIFGEDVKDITNTLKPNNFGYKIGYISNKYKDKYQITLTDTLNQGDQIRIASKDEANMPALKIYDKENNLINSTNTTCYLKINEDLKIGDIVYKTKDVKYVDELRKTYPKEFKRFPLNIYLSGNVGEFLEVSVNCNNIYQTFRSDFILEEALNKPTDYELLFKQLSRLGDTVYFLNSLEVNINNVFIPVKQINELKRKAIEIINEARLSFSRPIYNVKMPKLPKSLHEPKLAVYATTLNQYEAALKMGIDIIYYDNVVSRNNAIYKEIKGPVLVGGYGGIKAYKGQEIISDYSLNVVNSEAVYLLHFLGVKRVTLSYEINKKQLNDLVGSYLNKNGGYADLEMIVYGRAPLLVTKYCPLKKEGLCDSCKTDKYELVDDYSYFPVIFKDCTTTILNGKILNLIDNLEEIKGINVFRLSFTDEDYLTTIEVIKAFLDKLKYQEKTSLFKEDKETRGHFNKEIM